MEWNGIEFLEGWVWVCVKWLWLRLGLRLCKVAVAMAVAMAVAVAWLVVFLDLLSDYSIGHEGKVQDR
jgi:hypothetical protein